VVDFLGECDKGDWWSYRIGADVTLSEFHEYSVEWEGSDLIYRLDGKEVHRNIGLGDKNYRFTYDWRVDNGSRLG